MGNLGVWQLVIVLVIVLVLFGAKRLPDAARGLGRSLKIFKSETQGLVSNNDDEKSTDNDDGEATAQEAPVKPKAVETSTAGGESQQGEVVSDSAQRRDA